VAENRPDEGATRRIVQDEMRGMGQAPPEPPISDPAPVGLAAFALTTFVLSCVNAGFIPESLIKVFVPLAFAYGGATQLLAGLFEFRNRNVFGTTAFTGYGAFWIALAILVQFAPQLGITEQTLPIALGWTLLAWAIFTFIIMLASFGVSVAVAVVLVLLFATYVILTVGQFTGSVVWIHVGGIVGIITAAAAWYTAAAGVMNTTYGRTVLPVGERE
jgi:uncharacterized protein